MQLNWNATNNGFACRDEVHLYCSSDLRNMTSEFMPLTNSNGADLWGNGGEDFTKKEVIMSYHWVLYNSALLNEKQFPFPLHFHFAMNESQPMVAVAQVFIILPSFWHHLFWWRYHMQMNFTAPHYSVTKPLWFCSSLALCSLAAASPSETFGFSSLWR